MSDVISANDDIVTSSNIEVLKPAADPIVATDALASVNDFSRVQPRQLSSGVSRGIQQFGSPDLYADSGEVQLIVAKDGLPNVLMGNQPNFGQGFYVSKPGVDATTNDDSSKWIFNSNQNTLKIVKTSYVRTTFSAAGSSYIKVSHNLKYVPIPFSFLYASYTGIQISSSYTPLPTFLGTQTLDLANQVVNTGAYLFCVADNQSIFFICNNATASAIDGFYIKYYLTQESVNI